MRRLKTWHTYPAVEIPQDTLDMLIEAFKLSINVNDREDFHNIIQLVFAGVKSDEVAVPMWLYAPKRWPDHYHLGFFGDAGWSVPKDNLVESINKILTMYRLDIHPKFEDN